MDDRNKLNVLKYMEYETHGYEILLFFFLLNFGRSAGVAPEVNLRNQACQRGIHSGFETQSRRHQRSK